MNNKKLEMLISAVNKDPKALAERMNIRADAIIINQIPGDSLTDSKAHQGENLPLYTEFFRDKALIRVYNLAEKGVGLSRNNALMRASGEISLFCDDDIIYSNDAPDLIIEEFKKHPEADMLLFNVDVVPERRTYHNDSFGPVRLYNCGRYAAYSFAIKTQVMHRKNLCFSLLFGGGARYSNGEDSLFISDCIKRGVRVYKTPVTIGREVSEGSTWFFGYNEKFFTDRGVLYHYLYGPFAALLSLRFILAHKSVICKDMHWKKAFSLMLKGIHNAEL